MFSRRASERFADLQELGIDASEYDIDGPLFNRRPALDQDQLLQNAIEDALEDTSEIRALTGRRDGRPSDVDLGVFGEIDEPDEPTFRFTVPQRIRQPVQVEPIEDDAPLPIEDDVDAGADLDLDAEGSDGGDVGGYGAPEWESDAEIEGENDADLQAYRGEESAIDRSLLTRSPEHSSVKGRKPRTQNRELKISAAGIEYPSFSAAVVKRLATGLAKSQGANAKISKDTLAALVQTTDWFFEDVSLDLAAYAQHAGRKSIEDADVIALMKRYAFSILSYIYVHLANKFYLGNAILQIMPLPFLWPRKCSPGSCCRNFECSL
jgi:histone H3/H4